jgi:PhzF family phenazine biosynthesis protein
MTERRYLIIDVFASRPLAGNPLALVVDAEGMTSDDLQRIAAWTNLSETAFLLPPTTDEADYRVRIFTTTTELPFAGHPTLGSARGWLHAGGSPRSDGTVVQECGAGLITVRGSGDALAFRAPPLVRDEDLAPDQLARLVGLAGIDAGAVVAARRIDNGLEWTVLLLESAEAVTTASPAAWSAEPLHLGLVGPHPDARRADGPLPGARSLDYEVRAFFASSGGAVKEDPVTGSLNAGVARWLLASGRQAGPYTAGQGGCIGRDGRVEVDLDGDRIWIGGRTDVLVTGTLRGFSG